MKRAALFTAFVLAALAAQAAPMKSPSGTIAEPPTQISLDGRLIQSPTEAEYAAAGWTVPTLEELAAEAAAKQAQADAQAAYADPQPAVFLPRVGDSLTNIVGLSQIFVDTNGTVFAVDETGSPEKTLAQKQAQRNAATADKSTWRQDNRALRASLATNAVDAQAIRDGLSPTSTTAQVRSGLIALAREHDQLVADVRELRRLLTRYVREDDQ